MAAARVTIRSRFSMTDARARDQRHKFASALLRQESARSRALGVGHLKNGERIVTLAAANLPAIIKPKIVRHTIILSAKNLFLLALPTSPSGRVANPAVIIFQFEVLVRCLVHSA